MTLTWNGGSGNWTDPNWGGTSTGTAALTGTAAYTVTLQRYNGSELPVTINDPHAVLQMAGGAWLGSALTIASGTLATLANVAGAAVLPAAVFFVENVGGTILVPALSTLNLGGLSNNGQMVTIGNVLLGGDHDVNTGTIAIDQGTLALAQSGTDRLANSGTITLAHGGVLDVSHASLVANGTPGIIRFLDRSGATIAIGDNAAAPFGSVIDAFQASDVIDLVTAHYDKQSTASYSGGVLRVHNQLGLVTSLRLTNIQGNATFSVASDGSGGMRITTDNLPPATAAPQAAVATAGSIRFVDTSPEAQAARLYYAAFGRAPDDAGLAYWSAALHGGASLDALAAGFLASAEFQTRYGTPDNGVFLADLYQNVLHRGGDAAGLAYWQGVLDNGIATRTQVLVGFSESAENRQNTPPSADAQQAARLYEAALGRAPDEAGLTFWTSQLSNGTATLAQEADALAGSPEFIGRYGNLDDTAFVSQLYQNVLGRAADPTGLTAWIGTLANGASRGTVVTGFSESSEMKARFAAVIGQDGILLA